MITDSQIIDALGGNNAVGKLCEISSSQPGAIVSGWRTRGIPSGYRRFLKEKFPEVFALATELNKTT